MIKKRMMIAAVAAAAAAAANIAGADDGKTARMDRSKLLIGAYCLQANARSDGHVKAIRDCGVDFIVGVDANDRATLDHLKEIFREASAHELYFWQMAGGAE